MNPGRVSIIIPNKDRADLLCAAIESVRAQSYADWELIVVDDASGDDSVRIAEALAQGDPRIRVLRRMGDRGGAPVCRNQGLAAASGEFVIFLDADDALAAHCVAQRIAVMRSEPSPDFAVFPCRVFLERPGDTPYFWNTITGEDDLDRFLNLDVPWQTAGPIWTRHALEAIGPWDEDVLSWQDWEFHIRALAARLRYRKLADADCFWRAPSPLRASIGRQSLQAAHIESQQRLLKRTAERLERAGLLSPHRKRLLAGVHFLIARNWLGDPTRLPRALWIWRASRRDGLVSRFAYLRGCLAICAMPARVPRKLERALATRLFCVPIAMSRNPMRQKLTSPGVATDAAGQRGDEASRSS